jgi:hypothetical protein
MTNYNHSSISANSWTRAAYVVIDNPLQSPDCTRKPSITFNEELVIHTGDTYIKQNITVSDINNFVREELTPDNLKTSFKLLDSNGNPTKKTATYQDVYNMISSLYIHVAKIRDNRVSTEIDMSQTLNNEE